MKRKIFNNRENGTEKNRFPLSFILSPFFVLLLAAAIAFAGCNKDDELSSEGQGTITLTAVPHNDTIRFSAAAKRLVVDWGDGSATETYGTAYGPDVPDWISHTYTSRIAYTVQIKVEGLAIFKCFSNQITSLNVSGCTVLKRLYCWDNQLTSLDVSGCPALEYLYCEYNQLTSLDVSKCPALLYLDCWDNQITSLDVSKCPALEILTCSNNQITSLNASGCTALHHLECYGNQLTTSLDVSGCVALEYLHCSINQLTSLDVSGCTALQVLHCSYNQLTAAALDAVFMDLPNRTGEDGVYISVSNNPGTGACDRTIAEDKGWRVNG